MKARRIIAVTAAALCLTACSDGREISDVPSATSYEQAQPSEISEPDSSITSTGITPDGTDAGMDEPTPSGSIYSYTIIGYIDKEQKHLLMQRRLPTDGDPTMYEFAVYDTESKKIIGTLENDYDEYCYYDDYISISSLNLNGPQSETTFALYDSSLNKIKMIEGDVWELPLYLDDEDIFIGGYYVKTADGKGDYKWARYDTDGKLIDFFDDENKELYPAPPPLAVNGKLIFQSTDETNESGEFVEIMNYDGSDYRIWQIYDEIEYHKVGRLGKYVYFLPDNISGHEGIPGKAYFYDTEKDDLIYVDTVTEHEVANSTVSPDGKYLVTNFTELKDKIPVRTFIRFYDIEKNELVYTYTKEDVQYGCMINAYFDGVQVRSLDGNYFLKYEDLGL